jgi:DNA polymerase epsilon subunit 1
MVNHLSGIKTKLIKLRFKTVADLMNVRSALRPIVQKNKTKEKILSYSELLNPSSKIDLMDMIQDLREDDVPFHVRVCIDNNIRCGFWYKVTYDEEMGCRILCLEDKMTKADLRVLAFDIETSKAPLKFPDSRFDSVMLISYVIDGHGFLITNRSIISQDIADFEYSPKPEFEGFFKVFNEEDERKLLERFIIHCKELRPSVFVTYNGDFFDLPFIQERMKVYGLNMEAELGIGTTSSGSDTEFSGRFSTHMDCFYWVKRDAFLPQGSHGLKAVTKAKLGYDPIEVDPEKMMAYAREQPQQLCAYSVSDSLATYFLYKLMIHDFIYALCTIIPTCPDEVLRKGSGTLCEELLMAKAFSRNILFPNKQIEEFEKFFNGHLIDTETYIGGHVECLNVGVYRKDIPNKFKLDPEAYNYLIENIEEYIRFCIEIENGTNTQISFNTIDGLDDLKKDITNKLLAINNMVINSPANTIEALPLIYHLDVSAMYPNIILTNRLQPVAIVDEQTCAGCLYNNRPENKCKRYLNWNWKGELFPLSRSEYENLKHQYEFELLNTIDNDKDIVELSVEDHRKKFIKIIKNYCSKIYKQIHLKKVELKEDTVCMRENSFYVDTVRDFRDRRYEFKHLVKVWKGKLDEAIKSKDFAKKDESKNMMNLYESLQLAHKIILNSFYGYVMRKGARWHSMEMAAMVTHIGSSIITESKNLVERIGKPLELDTDGIWCLLPEGFPESIPITFTNGKKINLSFPCTMLNYLVYNKYCNDQYQEFVDGQYQSRKEMSIFFEVDGPYRCMVIPAAKEEGKMLKKRYAVFAENGKLHELKGFELKRRGELNIIKIFQSEVFDCFLKGVSLKECYAACAEIADRWYSILERRGEGITDDELLDYIEESRVMSKSVTEYGAQKSTSITCAKRMAEIFGNEMIKDKGLCTKYIIARKPLEAPVAERAIPTVIFHSDDVIRKKLLRKWLKDYTFEDIDMKEVIDWEYYKERLAGTILKILIIPAALQKVENPLPKIAYPDWVNRMMKSKFENQRNLKLFFQNVGHMELADPNAPVKEPRVADTKTPNKPNIKNFFKKKDNKIEYEEGDDVEMNNAEEEEVIDPVNMLENFDTWLKQQQKHWRTMKLTSKKTQSLSKSAPKGGLFFQQNSNNKENSFKSSTLKILQMMEVSPGYLKVWVIFDNFMECINVSVRRKIYINSYNANAPDVFKSVKLVLPRNKPVLHLYEFEIEEKEFKEKFNNFNDYIIDPSIEGVYETKLNLLFRAITEYGCQIRYVNKSKKVNLANSQTFLYEDFEPKYLSQSPENNYLNEAEYSNYYIYHSNQGARHLFVLFLFPLKKVHFFIVNSITKNLDIPNIKKTMTQLLEKEDDGTVDRETLLFDFEILTQIEPDLRIVIKTVNKILFDLKQNAVVPCIITVQSTYKISKLASMGFNVLYNEYPVMEIPFNNEDNNYPALDWVKYTFKKLAPRYLELKHILDFRLNMAKYCNIPLCNMDTDTSIFCIDSIFARLLKQSKQILWFNNAGFPDLGSGSDDHDFLGEIEYEFPKINNSGMYLGYSVEIDIGLFCVNAILESEHIKDIQGNYDVNFIDPKDKGNKHGTHVTDYHLERDEFVLGSNAFFVMKKMVEKWLNDVKTYKNYTADVLLINFYRWIASFNSKFFDPVLQRMINKLMQKYFSVLIRKIKEFGFNIIYADFKKIFIFNNKSDPDDFHSSIQYLIKSIKKIPIFNHITLTENTYWKIILFKDFHNFMGIQENETHSDKVYSKFNLSEFLPPILAKDFISLISDYIIKLYRFYYFQDFELVVNLYSLYLGKAMTMEEGIEFVQKKESLKEFKEFLVKEYLTNKVLSLLPNIRRKTDPNDRYLDDDIDNFEELNIESDGEKSEKNPDMLFTRKDFGDEDEDEAFETHKVLNSAVQKKRKQRMADQQKQWEFPAKLGGYQQLTDLPLEYIKYLSEVLALDEEVTHQAYILKKNAMKTINVQEFAQDTYFNDPCRTFILHDVICESCANFKDLDLCKDKLLLNNMWICDSCNAQYDKSFIEFLIIQKVKNIVDYYYNQDLYCKKCKMQKNDLLDTLCGCAGEYVKTFEDNIFKSVTNIKTTDELIDTLLQIANYYSFENLKAMLSQFKN